MTDVEIASRLNISNVHVGRLRKEGMPVDSIEAAQAWRDRQTSTRKPSKAPIGASVFHDTSDNPEDSLRQLKKAISRVEGEIDQAQSEGDRRNLAALWREMRGLSESRIACERQLLAWRIEKGELIRVDHAITRYAGGLSEIRGMLSNIPDRLCALLNPEHPDAARRILGEELQRIGQAVTDKLRVVEKRRAA